MVFVVRPGPFINASAEAIIAASGLVGAGHSNEPAEMQTKAMTDRRLE
jgi:hypothetical protein